MNAPGSPDPPPMMPDAGVRGGGTGGLAAGGAQLRALTLANWRFWGGVARTANRELARWRELASTIEDQELRELALAKLEDEAFNAEVAATLATLAPKGRRTEAVKAIVALEVLFDYLDGRTEGLFAGASESEQGDPVEDTRSRWWRPARRREPVRGHESGLEQGRLLFAALPAVLSGEAPELGGADAGYIDALWRGAHEHLSALPGRDAVGPAALAAAVRCGEAQLRLHAAAAHGDRQLAEWAEKACDGSGLGWREYVGGCASSVLAMHALIAAAARAEISEAEALALDRAYLAIGAVITTLDSLVDESEDAAAGQEGYIRLYTGGGEIEQRLLAVIAEALTRCGLVRDGAHHAMTLAGVAAYYTTHPGAGEPQNRAIRDAVRHALEPTIWPALAVLSAWRAAKGLRLTLTGARRGRLRAQSGERHASGA